MDTTPIHIAPVSEAQVEQLAALSRQTFYESFASHNTEANMQAHLQKAYSTTQLLKELTSPHAQFYFALAGNEPVGYIKLNFAPGQSDLQDNTALELERIYVLQAWQGRQIGQQLLQKAIGVAREHALQSIWLGVWEHNPKAIAFYRKHGFVAFSTHVFTVGTDEQTDILFKLAL